MAVPAKMKMTDLQTYLSGKIKGSIEAVLPKHLTPERMLKIVYVAASREPKLLECSKESIAMAVVTASQLGLEPSSAMGQAYLVPYKNWKKNNQLEAQLIIGYKGMIDLARRGGHVTNIEAHVVHEKDTFEIQYGLEPKLIHKPYFGTGDPGKPVAAYAIALIKDGGYQTEVMTLREIEAIRDRNRNPGKPLSKDSPWVRDFEEMARKTVVKRLCKYLPMSVELANAVALDNAAETGESQTDIDVIDVDGVDVTEEIVEAPAEEAAPNSPEDLGFEKQSGAAKVAESLGV